MKIPEALINEVTAAVLEGAATESGLNQKALAAKADMSAVTVQKLLSGNQSIKTHQLLALALATDLTPAEVMDRIDKAVARRLSQARPTLTPLPPLGTPETDEDHDAAMDAAYEHLGVLDDREQAEYEKRLRDQYDVAAKRNRDLEYDEPDPT